MTNSFGIEEYLEFTDERLHGEIRELGDYLAYLRKDVLKFKSQKKLIEFLGLARDRTWISKFENTQDSKYTFPPPGYVATLFVSIVKTWPEINQLVDLKTFLLHEFRDIWEHNRNEWKNELQTEINDWSDVENLSGRFLESQRKQRDDIQTSHALQNISPHSIPSHQAKNFTNYDLPIVPSGIAPAPPKLFVGREKSVRALEEAERQKKR